MESLISKTKDYLNKFLEVGVLLLAVSIIAEILFGPNVPFFGSTVTNNFGMTNFAVDLDVDHISVKNGVAALSLGSKGIALYDVSDPTDPIERGIFPLGYVYKTEFWGERLVVCSREGLKVINIEK